MNICNKNENNVDRPRTEQTKLRLKWTDPAQIVFDSAHSILKMIAECMIK